MARSIAPFGHELGPEISFGRQSVVSLAAERQIRGAVLPTSSKGLEVMQLEVARLAAALASSVEVAAATRVALVHLAPQRCRNVPTAPVRRRAGRRTSGRVHGASAALARFGINAALARFGINAALARFGVALGRFGVALGRFGVALGRFGVALGRFGINAALARFGVALGRFGINAALARSGVALGRFGVALGRFGINAALARFWINVALGRLGISAALARFGVALVRLGVTAALARWLADAGRKLSLFERRHEQLHRFEVQLAERNAGALASHER
ncbi:MAG TPA: hypothetical protein VHB79_39825, partial [Polyangiaceae bacterium]|nr:hypothetical protein [Polyangiaceae bacterium]